MSRTRTYRFVSQTDLHFRKKLSFGALSLMTQQKRDPQSHTKCQSNL